MLWPPSTRRTASCLNANVSRAFGFVISVNTGHIRAAARLGDEVIAAGMQRQVDRRDASGTWADLMQGLPVAGADGVSGFECVLAVSASEIYGTVWRSTGRTGLAWADAAQCTRSRRVRSFKALLCASVPCRRFRDAP
jgi:hypothetical protein